MLQMQIDQKSGVLSYKEATSGTISGLARKLIATGVEDQSFEVFRGDTKCLTYKSLKWAAEHVLREEPNFHYRKYRAFRGV